MKNRASSPAAAVILGQAEVCGRRGTRIRINGEAVQIGRAGAHRGTPK